MSCSLVQCESSCGKTIQFKLCLSQPQAWRAALILLFYHVYMCFLSLSLHAHSFFSISLLPCHSVLTSFLTFLVKLVYSLSVSFLFSDSSYFLLSYFVSLCSWCFFKGSTVPLKVVLCTHVYFYCCWELFSSPFSSNTHYGYRSPQFPPHPKTATVTILSQKKHTGYRGHNVLRVFVCWFSVTFPLWCVCAFCVQLLVCVCVRAA